jgi:hypothetical protein
MRLKLNLSYFAAFALLGMLIAAGCAKEDDIRTPVDVQIDERGPIIGGGGGTGGTANTLLLGLTSSNELVTLMSGPPVKEISVVPITVAGTRPDDFMRAIDLSPKSGRVFALSGSSVIYTIDPNTGIATPVSDVETNPLVEGDVVGFDVDPVQDVIRIITSTGQNLRVNTQDGSVLGVDSPLKNPAWVINGLAYAQSLTGLALFGVDITGKAIMRTNNPADGNLQLVGFTSGDWSAEGGFEITSRGHAFTVQYGTSRLPSAASITGDNPNIPNNRLYRVDLSNGRATSHGIVRNLIGITAK